MTEVASPWLVNDLRHHLPVSEDTLPRFLAVESEMYVIDASLFYQSGCSRVLFMAQLLQIE